jgi:hypothetical protein
MQRAAGARPCELGAVRAHLLDLRAYALAAQRGPRQRGPIDASRPALQTLRVAQHQARVGRDRRNPHH